MSDMTSTEEAYLPEPLLVGSESTQTEPLTNDQNDEQQYLSSLDDQSPTQSSVFSHPTPQNAPGASAAVGHIVENSIPLSIFPIATDKFVFAFSGLPGRGKTHISRRIARYLEFFHAVPVRVFNTAEYRQRYFRGLKDAEWFDPTNEEGLAMRNECNQMAIRDMIAFLGDLSLGVAIFDTTNPTHERRKNMKHEMQQIGAKVMFIEVSNEDEAFLTKHYHTTVQYSADYVGMNNKMSELDYRKKVDKYKMFYEPLDTGDNHRVEHTWSYMKCDHSQQHFVVHNVKGYLQQKVVNFIMNLRTTSHAFFLTRHGQSEYNDLGRIGGDSGLTVHGLRYAQKLAEFVENYVVREKVMGSHSTSLEDATLAQLSPHPLEVDLTTPVQTPLVPKAPPLYPPQVHRPGYIDAPARLWTSTMRRTKETAQFIAQRTIHVPSEADPSLSYEWVQMRPRAWHHLDELFAGSCDGMTYEEIEASFPDEWERRNVDKLAYRYPRGESYLDVIARLEPIIVEMERHQENLLIIGHQAVLRIIYAFYMGKTRAEAPYLSIPLNTVIKLVPGPVECKTERYVLYSPVVDLGPDGQDEPNKSAMAQCLVADDPPSH